MPITAANLTANGVTTNASSYTTASVTPGANTLIIVSVSNNIGTAPVTTPTLSGNGLTYVQIDTLAWNTVASPVTRTTMFRAMGASPSAGAITIDFGGTTQNGCIWAVNQFSGTDTSGTNGSGAVVQSALSAAPDTNATSVTVTLASFGDAANNAAYISAAHSANEAATQETGWTELSDNGHATPNRSAASAWLLGEDTSPSYSWASNTGKGAIAIEVKAAAAGGAAAAAIRSKGLRTLALTGAGI